MDGAIVPFPVAPCCGVPPEVGEARCRAASAKALGSPGETERPQPASRITWAPSPSRAARTGRPAGHVGLKFRREGHPVDGVLLEGHQQDVGAGKEPGHPFQRMTCPAGAPSPPGDGPPPAPGPSSPSGRLPMITQWRSSLFRVWSAASRIVGKSWETPMLPPKRSTNPFGRSPRSGGVRGDLQGAENPFGALGVVLHSVLRSSVPNHRRDEAPGG